MAKLVQRGCSISLMRKALISLQVETRLLASRLTMIFMSCGRASPITFTETSRTVLEPTDQRRSIFAAEPLNQPDLV